MSGNGDASVRCVGTTTIWTSASSIREVLVKRRNGLTVERYDLNDVDLLPHRDQLLPPSDEEPVVAAVDPLAADNGVRQVLPPMHTRGPSRTFLFQDSGP